MCRESCEKSLAGLVTALQDHRLASLLEVLTWAVLHVELQCKAHSCVTCESDSD